MNRTRLLREDLPWRRSIAQGLFAITLIALCSPGFAAKGGIPGPPSGGESANNLSTPGLQTESAITVEANWSVPGTPILGTHYSYGCDVPQSVGQFSYPNTTCVDNPETPTIYYDDASCKSAGMPCAGQEVSRIYWQKVDVNEWWADDDGILGQVPEFAYVDYIDWGDALEAVSWNERSVIRVETQPWGSTLDELFDPTVGCIDPTACKTGFQMWHVSGQGITEHWGVRATDANAAISFNYDSPFQIIKSTNARLNLTKMAPGDALCSEPGGNPGDLPPAIGPWDKATATWGGTCTLSDAPYTVETSVGGKYVYGFNWRMKNVELESLCGPDWQKTGFWRLTFYVPDDAYGNPQDVVFHADDIPNVAPPALVACDRTLPVDVGACGGTPPPEPAPVAAVDTESEDPGDDDRLYRPMVDSASNLSYLDICIKAKPRGGGGGGGRGDGVGGGKGSGQGDASSGAGGGKGGGGAGGGGGKH